MHPFSAAKGVACAASAFLIWGLSPLYWDQLHSVPAIEIILHRVVWSFLFLLPVLLLQGQWQAFKNLFSEPRLLAWLTLTAALVSVNWLIYIWAVNNGYVVQASLGYYINPLVNVLLGRLFLQEKLRPLQKTAVIIATVAVIFLTSYHGQFPWVSLSLAFSFGFYGLIRKMLPVGALVGLAVETLLISFPAAAAIIWLYISGKGHFLTERPAMDMLLIGASLITATPLLLFNLATRRLHLSTIGFLQYIAPSGMFFLAVVYFKEQIAIAQLVTFVFIWLALLIYSGDAWATHHRAGRQKR